jgi:uncharacterized membrane protein YphA (DoxX/SURF4 family)
MNIRSIAYWVTTGLTAFMFLSGGAVDVARPKLAMEGMRHLGYPDYFMVILGVWKVLGGIVILAPGLPRLKEWAYAGMLFDLTGAAASHASVGDPMGKVATPIILLLIVAASWALRPESRKLRETSAKPATNASAQAADEGVRL